MSVLKSGINKINKRLLELSKKLDKTPKYVEMMFWSLFIVLFAVISYYHEPWEDELQSFFIAKETTYYEMIFRLGHGEGHPALWWILLSIPAKIGLGPDVSLKLVSFIFSIASAYIIIFKFHIPKIFRLTVPFTFFIFYQYGIVSRCYCIYVFAMSLLTLFWNKRSKKPFITVMIMSLVCFSGAYGIVIILGLAAIWVFEIIFDSISEKRLQFVKMFLVHKNEIISLFILALVGLLLALEIWPVNSYAVDLMSKRSVKDILFRLLYLSLIEPIDALFYTSTYNEVQLVYSGMDLNIAVIIIGIFLTLLYYGIIMMLPLTYGKRKFFIIPQILYIILSSSTFYLMHHVGITTMFFIFWIATCYEEKYYDVAKKRNILENTQNTNYEETFYGKFLSKGEGKVLLPFTYLLFVLPTIVSLNWGISSSIMDITWAYSPNKIISNRIDSYGDREFKVASNSLAMLNAYKSEKMNVCAMYFNGRRVSFILNEYSDVDYENKINDYKSWGYPDIIVSAGSPSDVIAPFFDANGGEIPNYRLLEFLPCGKIYKGLSTSFEFNIFMRDDLADELGGLGKETVKIEK